MAFMRTWVFKMVILETFQYFLYIEKYRKYFLIGCLFFSRKGNVIFTDIEEKFSNKGRKTEDEELCLFMAMALSFTTSAFNIIAKRKKIP